MFLTDVRNRAHGQPIRRQQLRDDRHATSYVLQEVQEALQTVRSDWTLANFGLPLSDDSLPPLEQQNDIESPEAQAHQREELLQTSLSLLNTNQRHAFDEIVGSMIPGVSVSTLLQGSPSAVAGPSIPTQSGRLFFLDAPGETGKHSCSGPFQTSFVRAVNKSSLSLRLLLLHCCSTVDAPLIPCSRFPFLYQPNALATSPQTPTQAEYFKGSIS